MDKKCICFSPKAETKPEASSPKTAEPAKEEKKEPEDESDVELDLMDTLVAPDEDPSQEMGDENKEPTEEEMDQASELRGKATKAFGDGEFEDAINFYTEAILLTPSALMFAKRGQAFIKLNKPNAAIRDCDRALKLNPDNATAYKFRGRAYRLLGDWTAAAKDLRQACKLDFDEQADEWLKEVTPNAQKLEQHKIKQERKKAEKEDNARRERVRIAQEANKKAAEENEKRKKQEEESGDGGDFMGGGMDPDLLAALGDPEVSAALQDCMTNPGNIMKYANNPKVMNLIKKLSSGMGGGMGGGFPGMGGGFPGGMGGFPGFGEEPPSSDSSSSKPKESFDDGLD